MPLNTSLHRPLFGPLFCAITDASSSAWSPKRLFAAGEQGGWYDPSDLSSMFQDSAGTTPAVVDAVVGKLNDKSGRGNHMVQATTAAKPILRLASGRYYLEFDGVDDGMASAASVDFSAGDKLGLWLGAAAGGAGGSGMIIESSIASDANAGSFYIYVSSGTPHLQLRGSAIAKKQHSAGMNTTARTTLSGMLDIAGATIAEEILPTTNNSAASWTTAVAGPAGTGNLGNYTVYLCRRAGATIPFAGSVYSVILRAATSSAAQIANTETYVNTKTGAY